MINFNERVTNDYHQDTVVCRTCGSSLRDVGAFLVVTRGCNGAVSIVYMPEDWVDAMCAV